MMADFERAEGSPRGAVRIDGEGLSLSPDGAIAMGPVKVGMLAFIASEAAFFGTLIMTYIYFLRQTTQGTPGPGQVFRLPMVLAASACLFSSSGTVHLAEKALRRGDWRVFLRWWGLTIVLGALFLLGTMIEWRELVERWGLTVSRNLFGSTYFTLVGFHALHVTVGVIIMSIIFGLAWRRQISERNETGVTVVAWYWHFVDGVWLVVLTLVYFVGR